jgi:hypothetical protein
MRKLLSVIVLIFGIVCGLIALTHIILGHASVPGHAPGFSPTDDSEDRFYATLFLGFGAAMAWCSRNLAKREQLFGALLLIFVMGGLARIISAIQVGLPIPLFQWLGAMELLLPPLLWWWHKKLLDQDLL